MTAGKPYMEFFRAVKSGDVTRVVELIDNDDDKTINNVENEEGKTGFQIALEMENYGKIFQIIQLNR